MLTSLYLGFNAAAYVLLGLWCAVAVDKTAASLGYVGLNGSGRCEYGTVYGGLQIGLGLVFAAAIFTDQPRAGLAFAILLYGPIVLLRAVSLLRFGPVAGLTRMFAGFEAAMLVAALALWFGR